MSQEKHYHMKTTKAWFKRVQAFVVKHDFKSVADFLMQAADKFMKEFK